jgi:putative transposase
MARLARVVVPSIPHHVTQRGVRSLPVFFSDEDRLRYLRLLKWESERHGLTVLSYCLMDNHVHLVVVPATEKGLARPIGEAHRRYTKDTNERQGTKGYLFQGRFYSCPMDERHTIVAIRYTEQNPVRARMVKTPWDYRWSSARFRIRQCDDDPVVRDRHPFGLDPDWKQLLLQGPSETAELRKSIRTGRPFGSRGFIERLEIITGRTLLPKRPGPKQKPPRETAQPTLW